MATYKRFEDLPIWQEARDFSKKVFWASKEGDFSKESRLCSQIRASSGSIMDNIAEGFERAGNKEFINFLYIAKGSCGEVRSQLIRAKDVGYLTPEEYDELYADCRKLSASILNFVKEVRASEYTGAKFKEFNGYKVQED